MDIFSDTSHSSPFSEAVGVTRALLSCMEEEEWDQKRLPTASSTVLKKMITMTEGSKHLSNKELAKKNREESRDYSLNDSLEKEIDPERATRFAALRKKVLTCQKCPHLVTSRTQVVFGVGNPNADLMLVGEAPGEEEDLRGEPFVGRAGQLLTKILSAMEYTREEIFIANVLKCRPDMPPHTSGNRKPKLEEMTTCLPWLREQIELIQPRVMVALGATAMEGLLGETILMRDARGKWYDFHRIPVMVTYHPSYLLRNQSLAQKRKVWEDMLLVLERLGRPISAKQRGYFLA